MAISSTLTDRAKNCWKLSKCEPIDKMTLLPSTGKLSKKNVMVPGGNVYHNRNVGVRLCSLVLLLTTQMKRFSCFIACQ